MTPHLWPLRSYLELGALPTAVPCARLHARQLVWEWGLNGLAANTELLVSELVTNAVKATAGNNDQAAICLQLSGDNTRVLIEVWDADPQPPVLKDLGEDGTPDPQEEGGRGLCLIAALSTRWAWYLSEKPTGKVVWCELTAEPPRLLLADQRTQDAVAHELDVVAALDLPNIEIHLLDREGEQPEHREVIRLDGALRMPPR